MFLLRRSATLRRDHPTTVAEIPGDRLQARLWYDGIKQLHHGAPPDKYDYKYAHSRGVIVANTEVKIIKEDGTEAGVGESGEILARARRSS